MFRYTTLSEKTSIRILELLPGSEGSPLRCHLSEVDLYSNPTPSFEALSYTWGVATYQHHLDELLTNSVVPISDNLYKALSSLRLTLASRFLWIDAICINQTDNTEKSSQVAFMGEIYTSATKVLVWLGDRRCSDIFDGFTKLNQFYHDMGYSLFETGTQQEGFRMSHVGTKSLQQFAETYIMPHFSSCFDSDWFDRVWTVQEFVMASDITMYAADRSINYDEFSSALYLLVRLELEPLFSQDEHALEKRSRLLRAWAFVQGREKYQYIPRRTSTIPLKWAKQKIKQLPLVEWCIYYRSHQCSNAHDRVYGMLGLTGNNLNITPDYDMSIEQVWADLTHKHLAAGDLSVLRYAEPASAGDALLRFPFSHYLGGFGTNRHRSGQHKCRFHLVKRNSPSLLGLRIGRVKNHTSQTLPPGLGSPDMSTIDDFILVSQRSPDSKLIMAVVRHIYTECESLASQMPWPYHDGFLPVFARSIVASAWNDHKGNYMTLQLAIVLLLEMWSDKVVVRQQKLVELLGPQMMDWMEATKEAGAKTYGKEDLEHEYWQYEIFSESAQIQNKQSRPLDDALMCFSTVMMEQIKQYQREAGKFMYGRVWFITEQGYMGIGPQYMREGDLVVVFAGAETPYIIRPTASSHESDGNMEFDLVGECYLAGWMNGDLAGHGVVDDIADEYYSTQVVEDVDDDGRPKARHRRTGKEKVLKRTMFQLSEIRVRMPVL